MNIKSIIGLASLMAFCSLSPVEAQVTPGRSNGNISTDLTFTVGNGTIAANGTLFITTASLQGLTTTQRNAITPNIFVNNGGNVSIGNDVAPKALLTVAGSANVGVFTVDGASATVSVSDKSDRHGLTIFKNEGVIAGGGYGLGLLVISTNTAEIHLATGTASSNYSVMAGMYYDSSNANVVLGGGPNNITQDILYLKTGAGGGQVGIGTDTPTSKLRVQGDLLVVSSATIQATAGVAATSPVLDVASVTATTKLLTVLANGKVGIGTATPAESLDVNGNIRNTQMLFKANNIKQTTTNGLVEIAVSYDGYLEGTTQFRDLNIYNGKNASVAFFDGTNSRVGIGTASPRTKLDVNGNMGVVGAFTVDSASATVEGQLLVTPGAEVAATSPVLDVTSVTASTKLFQVLANGKVTIGGSGTLGDALTILPANNQGIAIRESDDGNVAGQWYADASSSLLRMMSGGTVKIQFNSQGGASYINAGQSVGIGNAAPAQTLDVTGTFQTSGASTFASSMTVTGAQVQVSGSIPRYGIYGADHSTKYGAFTGATGAGNTLTGSAVGDVMLTATVGTNRILLGNEGDDKIAAIVEANESMTFNSGVAASSSTFAGGDSTTFSIGTSSGVSVGAGCVQIKDLNSVVWYCRPAITTGAFTCAAVCQ